MLYPVSDIHAIIYRRVCTYVSPCKWYGACVYVSVLRAGLRSENGCNTLCGRSATRRVPGKRIAKTSCQLSPRTFVLPLDPTPFDIGVSPPPGVGRIALMDRQHTLSMHAGAAVEPRHRQRYRSRSPTLPGARSATAPGPDAVPYRSGSPPCLVTFPTSRRGGNRHGRRHDNQDQHTTTTITTHMAMATTKPLPKTSWRCC